MRAHEMPGMQGARRPLALLAALLALLMLQACDQIAMHELKPGVSSVVEVRDRLGPAGQEWRNDDGSTVLEYSRQPEGTECFMLTIGSDGILQRIDQVLVDANFARIRPGMSGDEVRRILGKPAARHTYALRNETLWEWRIGQDNPMAEPLFFNVSFDASGKVIGTGRHTAGRNR